MMIDDDIEDHDDDDDDDDDFDDVEQQASKIQSSLTSSPFQRPIPLSSTIIIREI